MADITFSATMDEKDVQRALQNMVKENAKLRAEIGAGVNEAKAAAAQEREWQKLRQQATKEATQQMQALNSAAQKIKDSVATPFEEAKKKTAELRKHLEAGTISTDQYRLAYAKVAKEMKDATRDHAAESAATKEAAEAKREAIATAKAWATAEEVTAEKISKLNQALALGTIDAEKHRRALAELSRDLKKEAAEAEAAADAEKAHSQAVREATAVADKYATKEERVAAELKRLNALKDKGVLSSKDHARAVAAENAKLQENGEAANKSAGFIDGLTGKMAGFVSGLAGGAAIINVIRSEYDALIERQGKAADANISLATEQEALLMNLGGADAEKTLESVRKLSKDTKVKEEDVTRAVNDAMAARADLGVEAVIKAVGSVAKVRKFAPSEMAGLASATVDTQKQTGLGTDESLGFLLQLQGQARTKNLKGLAENFTPSVGGMMQMGLDRQTAGATLASLSHGMGDTTGAMTGTAGIQFAKQVREFGQASSGFTGGPEQEAKTAALNKQHAQEKETLRQKYEQASAELSRKDLKGADADNARMALSASERRDKAELKARQESQLSEISANAPNLTTQETLQKLMSDPAFRAKFLAPKDQGGFGATFEAKALPAVESLLGGGTQQKQFQAAKIALQDDPNKALKAAIDARGASPAMGLAEQKQGLANFANQEQLKNVTGAQSAVLRQQLDEFRATMGDGPLTQKIKGTFEDLSTGGVRSIDSTIASIEGDIADKQKSINFRSNLAPRGDREFKSNPEMAAAQKRDEEMVATMQEMIGILKEQRDLQQAQVAGGQAKAHAGAVVGRAGDANREGRP
jgi:hypothetical protein